MTTRKIANDTRLIALFLIACSILLLTGCAGSTTKDPSKTGTVNVIEQKEVANKSSGRVSIVAQSIKEVAERSVLDKGADTLMTVQKLVSPGSAFSSYDVGKGDRIVASVYNQEGHNGSDIWVFSGGKTRVTNTGYFNDEPSFSTDGKRLLYGSREFWENANYIWYSTATGTLPTLLTQGRDARWMDDEKIVFTAIDENSKLQTIWTLMVAGSELTQIISDPDLDCLSPETSPNGKHIAYVKEKPGDGKGSTRDVFVYTVETGLSQQITTNISRDDMPQWSETGDALFFRST